MLSSKTFSWLLGNRKQSLLAAWFEKQKKIIIFKNKKRKNYSIYPRVCIQVIVLIFWSSNDPTTQTTARTRTEKNHRPEYGSRWNFFFFFVVLREARFSLENIVKFETHLYSRKFSCSSADRTVHWRKPRRTAVVLYPKIIPIEPAARFGGKKNHLLRVRSIRRRA